MYSMGVCDRHQRKNNVALPDMILDPFPVDGDIALVEMEMFRWRSSLRM